MACEHRFFHAIDYSICMMNYMQFINYYTLFPYLQIEFSFAGARDSDIKIAAVLFLSQSISFIF